MKKDYRFGYFTFDTKYDPQDDVGYRLCPVCLHQIKKNSKNCKTISFIGINSEKSYFYSIHNNCYSQENCQLIEGQKIDL